MANPTSVKLGKRARSSLQRTVSRDSLADLSKPNGLEVLPPIADGGCTEADNSPPQEGAKLPLAKDSWAPADRVNVSLEGLRLAERLALNQGFKADFAAPHREVLRELGQGEKSGEKAQLVQKQPSEKQPGSGTSPGTKAKRKWWAMGSRASAAAATKVSPIKPSPKPSLEPSPEPTKKQAPAGLAQVVTDSFSKKPLVVLPALPPPADMEILHSDRSPKWSQNPQSPESSPEKSTPSDEQEASKQAQKSGTRGAAFWQKEQVSERLHHAVVHKRGALWSPRKEGGGFFSPRKEGGLEKARSPKLSPIVYCRQDSVQELAEMLDSCGSCRRSLDSKKDIYMYGGESAFCSVSCRSRAIAREESGAGNSSMLPRLW